MTVRRILFPVDFSASCDAMAPSVRRVADLFSAGVTLLHVVEPSASSFELLARPLREIVEDNRKIAQDKLASYLPAEFPAHHSERLVRVGDPAEEIVQAAREGSFDLIAMPTHAGTFRRMLLGSTTAKVLNDAACPVFTTQHAETISPRLLQHREIVCAIGLQKDSLRVLRYADETARAIAANLTLVHVIPAGTPEPSARLDFDEGVQSAEKQAARQRIEELQKAAGSRAAVKIAVGPVKDSLIEEARRLQADILLIGRSPEPAPLGRLRNLTYAVIRDAPCPVFSV
jgi:nucleotide-binding universal stress UspA family protein